MRQSSGYLIVRMPPGLAREYDEAIHASRNLGLFQLLCEKLGSLPRAAYRGFSRIPLVAFPSLDPKVLRSFHPDHLKTEPVARRRLRELLGDDEADDDWNDEMLPVLEAARDVFSQLESPTEYEIIRVARAPFLRDVDCLGYDVGYWGSDYFSIVCDSAVRPGWHPPDPECFDELERELRSVNESFLFASEEHAKQFRSWYRTQDWAETETEPDQFCVVQVNRVGG